MKNGDFVFRLEQFRQEMHAIIDRRCDQAFAQAAKVDLEEGQQVLPLITDSRRFKGEKPLAVSLGGNRIPVKTWKEAVQVIFQDCASDPLCRQELESLRNRVMGRQRVLLTDDLQRLAVPIAIAPGIYFEGKHDTEFLLRSALLLLDHTSYDYSRIGVELRPDLRQAQNDSPAETMGLSL